jgi:hypothetical protein
VISNNKLYKHKGRGHSPQISILRNRNKVPAGEPFSWQTLEILMSPAWRAMPPTARAVVDRVQVEHCQHAGTQNGKLPVTYDDFEEFGARRRSIKFGIMAAEALGWIDITEQGCAGAGDTRRAARYALTWVDRHNGTPRTDRWREIATLADARRRVEAVRAHLKADASQRKSGAKHGAPIEVAA